MYEKCKKVQNAYNVEKYTKYPKWSTRYNI